MSDVIDNFDNNEDEDFELDSPDIPSEGPQTEKARKPRKRKKNRRTFDQQFEERRINKVGKTKNKWRYDPKKTYGEE